MRLSPRLLLAPLLAIALAAGIKGYLDWAQTRPVALHKALPELQAALDGAHWVSPGLAPASTSRRTLYMVSFRTCPYCIDYEQTEFPKLQKAGVDTRVILIARRDAEGHSRSTPAERATVAELWRGRQWSLYQRWLAMPAAAWSSSDQVPPLADNDPARAADVEADRQAVERIAAVLSENGVDLHYPALIYQDEAGHWRGFIGYDPKAASAIRADLGVS